MAEEDACDHNCTCGHMQADHTVSGYCNACGDACGHNNGHYPSDCWTSPPGEEEAKVDPVHEARRIVAEDEQRKTEACRAEIEQVLAKYGRKLVVTQPQITIVPM
jgi:hypothetical protein